jgi:hypothetical protein
VEILILMRCISTVNEILLKGNSIFVNMHEEWVCVYDWGGENNNKNSIMILIRFVILELFDNSSNSKRLKLIFQILMK